MKNNMKKRIALLLAVLMAVSVSVTAFAAEGDFTGNTMSGDNDFYYTVAKEYTYTDISGVKLTWTVPVVKYENATVTTWDPDNLKWVQTQETATKDNEVSFTLTNRGSYEVKAKASYAATVEGSSSVAFSDNNDALLATIVNDDHTIKTEEGKTSEQYVTANCSATITGTVRIDDASKLTENSGKLGTYTVTIRGTKHTVTVKYYANADDAEMTTATQTVVDGAAITSNGTTITIGGTSYTTAVPAGKSFDSWGCNVETVTADMVITPSFK